MSDVNVSVTQNNVGVNVTQSTVELNVAPAVVDVSVGTSGPQGATGPQGASYVAGDPIFVTVRNATGSTLAKGTIVYTSGATGNHVNVSPALATSDATSARVLGWLSTSLANNADGLCQVEGYLEGLNTHGLTAGAQLYLSPTVAGGFTATKPQAPNHLVYVGVVTKVSSGDGHVYIKTQNGYELNEIHDVQIVSPANNQVLAYDSATQLWKNATNTPDGVTSITATAPLTGGTITSTGSIGLDQTLLGIAQSQVTGLVTVLAGKANLAGGNALTGTQTITSTASGEFPLSIISASGQTASTFRIRNSANNADLMSIDSSGQIRTSTILNPNSFNNSRLQMQNTGVFIDTGVTTNVPLAVRGSSGQTADLIKIQNNSASDLITVTSAGNLNATGQVRVGTTSGLAQLSVITSAGVVGAVIRGATSQTANLFEVQDSTGAFRVRINQVGNSTFAGNITSQNNALFTPFSAATVPLTIQGAASQTASLTQWLNSAGSLVATMSASGDLAVYGNGITSGDHRVGTATYLNAALNVQARATTEIGAVIRGASGQSVDMFQVQNSSATVLSGFGNTGNLKVRTAIEFSGALNVAAAASTQIGAVVRGAASQTANLQEWQNSAGSNLLWVNSAGNLNSGTYILGTQNSGAQFTMVRATAAATNPGANLARLYFRDGTNAGTLKLVVRAGAAGAETTILDNIPQS